MGQPTSADIADFCEIDGPTDVGSEPGTKMKQFRTEGSKKTVHKLGTTINVVMSWERQGMLFPSWAQ
jgi:hypothetical protein